MEKVLKELLCIKISNEKELKELQTVCKKENLSMAEVPEDEEYPLFFFCWDQNGENFLFYDVAIPHGHTMITLKELRKV